MENISPASNKTADSVTNIEQRKTKKSGISAKIILSILASVIFLGALTYGLVLNVAGPPRKTIDLAEKLQVYGEGIDGHVSVLIVNMSQWDESLDKAEAEYIAELEFSYKGQQVNAERLLLDLPLKAGDQEEISVINNPTLNDKYQMQPKQERLEIALNYLGKRIETISEIDKISFEDHFKEFTEIHKYSEKDLEYIFYKIEANFLPYGAEETENTAATTIIYGYLNGEGVILGGETNIIDYDGYIMGDNYPTSNLKLTEQESQATEIIAAMKSRGFSLYE
ncbi:MAG: hypothetical protein ACRC6X_06340 [Culicoidibacterales bacterium]